MPKFSTMTFATLERPRFPSGVRQRPLAFPVRGWRHPLRRLRCEWAWWLNWLFHRISEPYVEKNLTLERVEINGADLAKLVYKAVEPYRRRGIDVDFILMGPEQFHWSLKTALGMAGAGFLSQVRICERGQEQILGYPVRVVPGFDGVVVVPKVDGYHTIPGN